MKKERVMLRKSSETPDDKTGGLQKQKWRGMKKRRRTSEKRGQKVTEARGDGRMKEGERDGWRSISRKFVRKCWPEELESGLVCLFWLRGCPQQAPLLGTGREGCRGIHGGKD